MCLLDFPSETEMPCIISKALSLVSCVFTEKEITIWQGDEENINQKYYKY